MRVVFGEFYVTGKKSFVVGKQRFEVSVRGNVVKYSGPGGEKVVGNVGNRVRVSVVPGPVHGKYTNFWVVWLTNDIIVPPGGSVLVWVTLPVGVRVSIEDVEVDVFNSEKIKRCYFDCLSGSGMITGCSKVYGVVSYNPMKVLGGLNFVVKNQASRPAVIKKFPVLMKNTPVFFDEESAYYPWYKIVVGDNYALVSTKFTSPVNNLRSSSVVYIPGFEVGLDVIKREGKVFVCP